MHVFPFHILINIYLSSFLTGLRWHLTVVLSFIPLIINDWAFIHVPVGHLKVFYGKLFRPSAYFLTGLFVSLLSSCMSSLYILIISPLSDIWSANILSHSVCCHFILLVSLLCRSFFFFSWWLSTLFFLFFFKLYKIVLVLPNIKMNPPQVYNCRSFLA